MLVGGGRASRGAPTGNARGPGEKYGKGTEKDILFIFSLHL